MINHIPKTDNPHSTEISPSRKRQRDQTWTARQQDWAIIESNITTKTAYPVCSDNVLGCIRIQQNTIDPPLRKKLKSFANTDIHTVLESFPDFRFKYFHHLKHLTPEETNITPNQSDITISALLKKRIIESKEMLDNIRRLIEENDIKTILQYLTKILQYCDNQEPDTTFIQSVYHQDFTLNEQNSKKIIDTFLQQYLYHLQIHLCDAIENNDIATIQSYIDLDDTDHNIDMPIPSVFISTDACSPISIAAAHPNEIIFDMILSKTDPQIYPTDTALIKTLWHEDKDMYTTRISKLLEKKWDPNLQLSRLLQDHNTGNVGTACIMADINYRILDGHLTSTQLSVDNEPIIFYAISQHYQYAFNLILEPDFVWGATNKDGDNIFHAIQKSQYTALLKKITDFNKSINKHDIKIKGLINKVNTKGSPLYNETLAWNNAILLEGTNPCTYDKRIMINLISLGADLHFRCETGLNEEISSIESAVLNLNYSAFNFFQYQNTFKKDSKNAVGNNLFHLMARAYANADPSEKQEYYQFIAFLKTELGSDLLSQLNNNHEKPIDLYKKHSKTNSESDCSILMPKQEGMMQ
ncbi:MAG: hypothetical protein HAW62_03975 [Endozoicomonadaceae bacterium]|nr:hypothetical protein [Endozoicomonadaceae bacterium]